MPYETVLIEKRDQIGILTLNRPKKFNTFTTELPKELNGSLRRLDEDAKVRVVIIKGVGKVFLNGIDLSEFHGKTPSECHRWLTVMDQIHLTFAPMEKTFDCYPARICSGQWCRTGGRCGFCHHRGRH